MELDERALVRAIEHLLDILDEDHADGLMQCHDDRDHVVAAIAARARAVVRAVVDGGDKVAVDEYLRLAGAMLSSRGSGVHQNNGHALTSFLRFREHRDVPVDLLVLAVRLREECLPLLAATHRAVSMVRGRCPDADATQLLTPVVTAVLAATGKQPADVLTDVIEVLDRGMALVLDHYDAGRPLVNEPEVLGGTVLGNADFVLTVAAMRVALAERFAGRMDDPGDAVECAMRDLARMLRMAMTRPARQWNWHAHREPDALLVYGRLAAYLGEGVGLPGVATDVRDVHAILTPWRRFLLRDLRDLPLDFQKPTEDRPRDRPLYPEAVTPDPADALATADHVVGWLVAALFDRLPDSVTDVVVDWLAGRRAPDGQDHLILLIGRLHRAVACARALPFTPAEAPVTLSAEDYRLVVGRLLAAADPAGGGHRMPAVALAAEVLPELWTRRRIGVELVREQLTLGQAVTHATMARAAALAALVVRGPVQRFNRSLVNQPRHECESVSRGVVRPCSQWTDDTPARRTAVTVSDICRDRPWREPGWVESWPTLAGYALYPSPDAARHQVARYAGEHEDLVEEAVAGD